MALLAALPALQASIKDAFDAGEVASKLPNPDPEAIKKATADAIGEAILTFVLAGTPTVGGVAGTIL